MDAESYEPAVPKENGEKRLNQLADALMGMAYINAKVIHKNALNRLQAFLTCN